jgi:hypothetical protein
MFNYTIIFKSPNGLPAQIEMQGCTTLHVEQTFRAKTGQEVIATYPSKSLLPHEISLIEQLIGNSELSTQGAAIMLRVMHELLASNDIYIDSGVRLCREAQDLEDALEEAEHIKYMDQWSGKQEYDSSQIAAAKEGSWA